MIATNRELARLAVLLATTTGAAHDAIAAHAEGVATAVWAKTEIAATVTR